MQIFLKTCKMFTNTFTILELFLILLNYLLISMIIIRAIVIILISLLISTLSKSRQEKKWVQALISLFNHILQIFFAFNWILTILNGSYIHFSKWSWRFIKRLIIKKNFRKVHYESERKRRDYISGFFPAACFEDWNPKLKNRD